MMDEAEPFDISHSNNNICNILEDSINNVYALTGVGYAVVDEDGVPEPAEQYETINNENQIKMEYQSILNNNDSSNIAQNQLSPEPSDPFLENNEETILQSNQREFCDDDQDQNLEIGDIEKKVETFFNSLVPSTEPNGIQSSPQEYEDDGLRVTFPPNSKFNFDPPKRINTLYPDPIDFSQLEPLETNAEQDQLCEKQLRDFQKSGTIPDNSDQQRLAQYVQRQKVNAIVSNSYKDAAKLEITLKNLVHMINESQKISTTNQRITMIQQKMEENNSKIEELDKETKILIENEQQRLESLRQEKEAQQENELKDFEVKWNDEDFLRKFAKPSVKLIQKQSLLHSYVILKEFDAAEDVKNDISKMEADESNVAQKKAEMSMMKEQERLLDKHENGIEAYKYYADCQLNEIIQQQEVKMRPLLARKKRLEAELDELIQIQLSEQQLPSINMQKVTKSAPASSLASSVPTSRMKKKSPMTTMNKGKPVNNAPRTNSSLTPVMTPRTRERYLTYKTQMRNPRITVKPLGNVIPKDRKRRNEKSAHIRK